jgi:hypothetical protein
MTERPNVTEEIERLIDRVGLLDVMTAIECVCGEKADHIIYAWQDKTTAKPWRSAERTLGATVRKIDKLGI